VQPRQAGVAFLVRPVAGRDDQVLFADNRYSNSLRPHVPRSCCRRERSADTRTNVPRCGAEVRVTSMVLGAGLEYTLVIVVATVAVLLSAPGRAPAGSGVPQRHPILKSHPSADGKPPSRIRPSKAHLRERSPATVAGRKGRKGPSRQRVGGVDYHRPCPADGRARDVRL
jgi:hypothetical protein